MGTIQFELTKEASGPISFSLSKVQKYFIELFWDSNEDLDVHAIATIGGTYREHSHILSTYNPALVKLDGTRRLAGGKGEFRNAEGYLIHHGDVRTGVNIDQNQPDESLELVLEKFPLEIDRVSFFVSMHPPHSGKFKNVQNARLAIKTDVNKDPEFQANLSHDFDEFDIVQMGSIVLNPTTGAWDFDPKSVGLNGDFNTVLQYLGN